MSVPAEGQQPRTEREGDFRFNLSRRMRTLTTAESAPASPADPRIAHSEPDFKACQWGFYLPSWCTSIDIGVYRLIEVRQKTPERALILRFWVLESTSTKTASAIINQVSNGQGLYVRVYNIVGTPSSADPIAVTATGINLWPL